MAKRLVEDMADRWKPEQYKDTYHDDLMARINERIKAGETHVLTGPEGAPEAPRSAEIIDLAALLRRSLEKKGKAAENAPAGEEKEVGETRRAAASKSPSTKRVRTTKSRARKRA